MSRAKAKPRPMGRGFCFQRRLGFQDSRRDQVAASSSAMLSSPLITISGIQNRKGMAASLLLFAIVSRRNNAQAALGVATSFRDREMRGAHGTKSALAVHEHMRVIPGAPKARARNP
jgi:hypothetical protein